MGTRATVARENVDGSYDTIYTHWDGHPSHHAPILLTNYSTPEKVQALLSLGDLSMLEAEIGKKHPFDWMTKQSEARRRGRRYPHARAYGRWCLAYGRDRGDRGTEAQHHVDSAAFERHLKDTWGEYVYIWRVRENRWYWTNSPSPTWFKTCPSGQLPLRPLEDWQRDGGE